MAKYQRLIYREARGRGVRRHPGSSGSAHPDAFDFAPAAPGLQRGTRGSTGRHRWRASSS